MEVIIRTIITVLMFDAVVVPFGLAVLWLANQLWIRRAILLSTDIPEKKKSSEQFYASENTIKLAGCLALYWSFGSAFFGGILIAAAIAFTIGFPIIVWLLR